MNVAEIIIIAVALAMDCFTVSIASGITSRRFLVRPMILMIILFGVFQGGMTALGWMGGFAFKGIVEPIDHWIAFILLTYLGIRMIYEGLNSKEEEETKASKLFCLKNILTMAVATSIDALAVGISFAFLDKEEKSILLPALVIAICSSIFTAAGLFLGIFTGNRIKIPAEPIGGIILICIGIKILVEHLT